MGHSLKLQTFDDIPKLSKCFGLHYIFENLINKVKQVRTIPSFLHRRLLMCLIRLSSNSRGNSKSSSVEVYLADVLFRGQFFSQKGHTGLILAYGSNSINCYGTGAVSNYHMFALDIRGDFARSC